jgi:hypothetical protein
MFGAMARSPLEMEMAFSASRHAVRLAALATLVLAAACGGDNGPAGDQPTSIAINAGNAQAVRYGTPVAIAPSVVVTNAGGPMEGVTVTFTVPVNGGGGTVTGGTTTSNAQGIATVGGWTLGPAPGSNTLRASAGSISINIDATAITGPASAVSIVTGNNQTWVQGSQVPLPPTVVVTDGQFPVPGAHVVFTVASGGGTALGASQTTGSDGVAAVGGWRLGSSTSNTLTAAVQSAAISPVTFTATAEPLVISAVTKVDGDNQTGFAGNFTDRKATVAVLNQFNQPTEGVPVSFTVSGGTIFTSPVTTALDGQAQLPWWRYGGAGAQSVTATAGAATPVTFMATATTVPISNFRINVTYPVVTGVPQPSDPIKQVFTDAVTRWQTLIVGGLPPVVLTGTDVVGPYSINTGVPGLGTVPCIPQIANQTVKDVNIYVYIRPIDGTTGTNILGLATPVYARDGSLLPYAGCMIFDQDNIQELLTSGGLYNVILHEMAHVFGFGTIWDEKGLLVGKCPTSSTPSYAGPSSQEGFVAALVAGAVYDNPITPVEGEGTCNDGTRDGHWSESVMGNELMTGFINAGPNPLSAITSASLRDLGYVVNDAPSDPYTVPSLMAALRAGVASDRVHELRVPVPIVVTDARGRTTRVIDR